MIDSNVHPSTIFRSSSYTQTNYVTIVYILIAFHFLSGVFVSDRKFRHALGFLPHILALGCTSYLFYSTILQQLTPWLKVRQIKSNSSSDLHFFRFELSFMHWALWLPFVLSPVYILIVFLFDQSYGIYLRI